jgi:hypothetical protein
MEIWKRGNFLNSPRTSILFKLIDMSAANDHVAVDWRDNDGSRRRRRIAWVGADPDQMLSGRRLAKAVLMADFPSSSAPLAAETQQKRKKVLFLFLMSNGN